MVYYVTKEPDKLHQITLDELYGEDDIDVWERINNDNNTHTFKFAGEISKRIARRVNVPELIGKVHDLNVSLDTLDIWGKPREELYTTFYRPKREPGKFRRIDWPKPELYNAEVRIAKFLEDEFKVTHHTSAYAYIKQRDPSKAAKKHLQNKSNWYGYFDLSGFFPSTTLEFMMRQLSMVFPYSEVLKVEEGKVEMEKLLERCFLNGGLPQGSPTSPFLTNLFMIPVDYELTKLLRNYGGQRFIYTRYADDFQISSRYEFDIRNIECLLNRVLENFNAPYRIKEEKTKYVSVKGRNWFLGIMLNANYEMTIGHDRKKHIKKMVHAYVMDKRQGTKWDDEFIRKLWGDIAYLGQVEPVAQKNMLMWFNSKYHIDLLSSFKQDLATD